MKTELSYGIEMLERISQGDFSEIRASAASAVLDELARLKQLEDELRANSEVLKTLAAIKQLSDAKELMWLQEKRAS